MAADHPFFFTWTAQQDARPVELAGGEGAWFRTADGERFLDLGSLIYQANLGHGCTRVVEAIKAQADRLCLSLPAAVYPEKTELARRLLAHAPDGFSKVFFTLGGSDANENAIKIARLFTGRHKTITRYRSYHGATLGALGLTGDWRRPPLEPLGTGAVHVDEFHCARCAFEVRSEDCTHEPLSRIPQALELEGPGTVAAVFLEPVVGGNGVLVPPRGALRSIREACDRHGTLLVSDEVLTGFGRTGHWFGFEREEGLVPDMITCGKAITGGYGTLGAVLVHERVAAHFEENPLVAGLTHYGHPLGIAAALEAMRTYEEEGLIARAAALEPVLEAGLDGLGERCSAVRQSRVAGLLSATELELDVEGFGRLAAALRKRRIHAHVQKRASALILSPPLVIGEDELEEGIAKIGEAIEEVS